MLAYLDTAIGFAMVMLGVSLIIMIIVQAISAALSYRGANLMWGLETLLSEIDSTNLPVLTANAKAVANAVLTHPLVSDSVLSNSGAGWIARSLRWIASLVPPALTKFRLASAIRSDELVAILSHLANNPAQLPLPKAGAEQAQLAADILALLGARNPVADQQVARDAATAASAVAAVAGPAAAIPVANAVPLIQGAVDAVRKEAGKLDSWFSSMMDRVSQRFAMHVRICTIILAFAAAVIMQLDAPQVAHKLYTDSNMRASFVGIAGSMSQIAQNLLPEGGRTPDEVQATMTNLFTGAVQKALTAQSVAVAAPTGIKTRTEGETWINKNVPPAQQGAVVGSYNTAVEGALNAFMRKSAQSAAEIKDILQKGGIQLFPAWSFSGLFTNFWGILLSGALLSLGAPFWFNSMKALLNLRPALAQRQKQDEQRQKAA
jgi:hypothetical protein